RRRGETAMSIQTPRRAARRAAAPAPTGLGDVLVPGADGYEEAPRTDGAVRSPALVVRPRDAAQVAAAVAHAGRPAQPLSVRSGGHGMAGRATNAGGMVVDLRHLDSVEVVDPRRRVVRVGAGATWGQVAAALAPHGLAVTSGDT